eukprot:gene7609-9061_t
MGWLHSISQVRGGATAARRMHPTAEAEKKVQAARKDTLAAQQEGESAAEEARALLRAAQLEAVSDKAKATASYDEAQRHLKNGGPCPWLEPSRG